MFMLRGDLMEGQRLWAVQKRLLLQILETGALQNVAALFTQVGPATSAAAGRFWLRDVREEVQPTIDKLTTLCSAGVALTLENYDTVLRRARFRFRSGVGAYVEGCRLRVRALAAPRARRSRANDKHVHLACRHFLVFLVDDRIYPRC